MSNYWQVWSEFPPYYVRLLAKSGPNTALSDAEIAIASGLDINRVRAIKILTEWDTVTHGEKLHYCAACNFDPTNLEDRTRARDYEYRCKVRNSVPFRYLTKSPKWAGELLPVLKLLQAKLTQHSSAA